MSSSSQLLSSILCISYLCSAANGFSPVFRPNAAMKAQGCSDIPILGNHNGARQDRPSMNLHATKGRSKAPATAIASSSDKVKEMASFLSIQLLERVMAEAMKPEGESTLDLEAVERITQALQTTNQSSPAETSTPTLEETSDSPSLEETAPIESEEAPEPTLSAPVETDTEDFPVPEATEIDSADALTETIQEVEEKVTAPTPEPVASTPQIPEIVRKPLEVVESNIPPLRPESVPQRTDPVAEDEPAEEETIEEVVVAATPEEVEEKEEAVEEIVAEEEESAEETTTEEPSEPEESAEEELARKKAQELFHRNLLQRKLEFDKKAEAKRIETETEAESSNDDTEGDTQKGESTITSTDSTVEPPQPESLTKKTPNISELERRVETILALRQPKTTDQESKLAEKYSNMENLEDRAYALLVNLGMIQEHHDPRDPSYDHSNDDDLCDQRYFPRM